jgi:hypothetical protein
MRSLHHEYFEVDNLPIGEIPFSAIQRALKDEKYLRRFVPTHYRNDLLNGHTGALLYWYPNYIDYLYELTMAGQDWMLFFKPFPPHIRDEFVELFPEIIKKLVKLRKNLNKLNHFEELNHE